MVTSTIARLGAVMRLLNSVLRVVGDIIPVAEEGVVGVDGDIAEAGILRASDGILRERFGRPPARPRGAIRKVGVVAV